MENKWNERELDLAKRAEMFDMELRRDDNGCYWLDFVNQPDMRSVGPMDLGETEDRIVAAENGWNTEQTEEYTADQRWKRLHPESEAE